SLLSPHRVNYYFSIQDTSHTVTYALSLHDALPISWWIEVRGLAPVPPSCPAIVTRSACALDTPAATVPTPISETSFTLTSAKLRSEEHTSELQSRENLVCRLLLEKKKIKLKEK